MMANVKGSPLLNFRSEFGAAPLKPSRDDLPDFDILRFPLRIRSGPVEALAPR